jgi:hypothetical protein
MSKLQSRSSVFYIEGTHPLCVREWDFDGHLVENKLPDEPCEKPTEKPTDEPRQ